MISKVLKVPLLLNGLTAREAEQSRKKHGANIITKKKKKNFLQRYLASFGDPIIKILLIALAINVVLLFRHSSWFESMGIALAVLVATFVSTISEYGSEAAFEKLQEQSQKLTCRVKRNNKIQVLPAKELVVGDVVMLQAGEKIPADGHLIWGDITVDQSALNGESKEVNKAFLKTPPQSSLDCPLSVFSGSVILGGEAIMVVKHVGDNTFYGKLAAEIQTEVKDSPLKARLTTLANKISNFGYLTAILIALTTLFKSFIIDSNFDILIIQQRFANTPFILQTIMQSLILAISVLVMSVPEGLPMMITVVLSANMRKMLKKNVLVRKLVGIETAGSLNILFTDKTGTLTKGRLEVTNFLSGERGLSLNNIKGSHLNEKLFIHCTFNNDAHLIDGKDKKVAGGNSTDRALLEFALKNSTATPRVTLVKHFPFNSKNKYSMSHIKIANTDKYLVKGAAEVIISRCKYYLDEKGNKQNLNHAALNARILEMGKKALRLLALAECDHEIDMQGERELTLVGVLGIRDEIRKESQGAIKSIQNAGVQTVMVTGDNKETAVAIALEIGLIKDAGQGVYTSDELNAFSDSEIKHRLPSMRVITRAVPTDKSRLVKLAQELGMVVGMTGDGINDAPALKNADVGFAMGTGTEVAKEASDIVILDNNISSIVHAMLYGRTIFKSIRKFLVFRLAMNFCAVTLAIVCPFLNVDAPLTVMQMLWVNMIIDALAGLAFAGEPPLEEYLLESPKTRDEQIISKPMFNQILITGGYITLISLLFLKLPFVQSFFRFNDGTHYFMTAFFTVFIFTGMFNSFNTRTERINVFSGLHSNIIFVITMFVVCVIQILLVVFGGEAFRTVALNVYHIFIILAIAITIIPVDVARKIWRRKHNKKIQIYSK